MAQGDEDGDLFGPRPLKAVTEGIIRRTRRKARAHELTPIKSRLAESAVAIGAEDPRDIAYQHSVFCQTGLPYRNPGDAVRLWERKQGAVALSVEAGRALDPETEKYIQLGLPFGPKPRLILAHLNSEALRQGSPIIEVEDSLTAFVRRLGVDTNGRNLRLLKEQLTRIAGAIIRLGVVQEGRTFQVDSKIVSAFDLWFPKDERQRVLWPSVVRLSDDYFNSLTRHAVPLDERAVAALANSAMGLDIYAWLAQRLHRIKPGTPQFIPWTALQAQFGWHYGRMDNFKAVFRKTLGVVVTQYRGAKFDLNQKGMTLHHSPPPVAKRVVLISQA